MRIKFLLAFLLGAVALRAQTIEVSGLQSGNWIADTVLVTGDVVVQDALTIGSGTTVLFNGYYGITVDGGSIVALGTEEDSIVFTVRDTTGFYIYNSGRGGWNGICLSNVNSAKFDYCKFQFAKAATDGDQDGGAFFIEESNNVEVNNSRLFANFAREHGGALYAKHSKVSVHACKVTDNLLYSRVDTIYFMYGGGMRFTKCNVELTEVEFRRNYGEISIGGALCLDSSAVYMDRCLFEDNYGLNGAGFYMLDCNDKVCSISNCLISNNHAGHFAGGFALRNASPEINNLTVVGNVSDGVNCGGIFFYQECSPVVRNCILWGNHSHEGMDPVQMWLWVYNEMAPMFYNCLIQGGLDNVTSSESIVVNENMMSDDPHFVGYESRNFHLSPDSPCINAGSPDTNPNILAGYDLDGVWRVCGSAIDLGAYEYSGVGVHETIQTESMLHVVGNPLSVDSYLELQLNQGGKVMAKVYSINGTLLRKHDYGMLQSGLQRLTLCELADQLAHGVYLIEVMTEEGVMAAKVVK